MHRIGPRLRVCLCALILQLFSDSTGVWAGSVATQSAPLQTAGSWWLWPLALFLCCIMIGMFAVLGGVGSGILYLALVSAIFPFHIDYVRMAALLVSLAGALIAGSGLLRRNLADIHLTLPTALVGSLGAACGAILGANLPAHLIRVGLGTSLLVGAVLMSRLRRLPYPKAKQQDAVGMALAINGTYRETGSRAILGWHSHATLPGLLLAFPIGLLTGVFGLEGAWAHVAVFNLIMGIPFKVAVGTGKLLLTFTHSTAAWIYLHQGCVLPLLVIPSIIGTILGSLVGLQAQLLMTGHLKLIRHLTLAALILGGIRVLLQGLAQ